MNLRLRLSLVLTAVLVATIAIGASYLIFDVRRAIREELDASVDLASKLISFTLADMPANERDRLAGRLASRLAQVGDLRHLTITVARWTGDPALLQAPPAPVEVPAWFIALVLPEPLQLVRIVPLGGGPEAIVLSADAGDEIREAWRELRPLLLILVAFGIVANLLIYIVLGRSLKSLNAISQAFQQIESGRYNVSIEPVGVPDIDAIAQRFNHMSDVLARTEQEARALARRSLEIQENERRRLAQELHDEMGQSISAIKALAVSIRRRTDTQAHDIAASADTIVEVSSGIYTQVRRMMAHLRPPVLDELGLVSALQEMVDDWNAHHEDTFCQFDVVGAPATPNEQAAINLYRIAQEALTNIAKHAHAAQASITLIGATRESHNDGYLELVIEDDGMSFDAASAHRGLGLVGMHERADALGARLTIGQSAAAGTHIRVVLHGATTGEQDERCDA